MTPPTIVWFRADLRMSDHAALDDAARRGPVVPLYVLESEGTGTRFPGAASRGWLAGSLEALGRSLAAAGSPLVLRRGEALAVLRAVIAETGARRVVWLRRYDPEGMETDRAVKAALRAEGIEVESFAGNLLCEGLTLKGREGKPIKVFSPFWRAAMAVVRADRPLPAPARLSPPATPPATDDPAAWALRPTTPDWADGMREAWTPGEGAAQDRLLAFLDRRVGGYKAERDLPGTEATSRLSPHLRWGEISPRQILYATRSAAESEPGIATAAEKFLSEVGWREFSWHLLIHNPTLPTAPMNPRFAQFPWADDPAGLRTWTRGRTGYPVVDAGMRELWRTGWMHNRVRMIAASFLVKDLLVPWQTGEAWFWDTLVDADPANNPASWQWVAGCGADAAPYFRIFNPVLQGEKFDPAGTYVRRWNPELSRLPDRWIHRPWEAPAGDLAAAGVRPGETYPRRVVDHSVARDRALAAFQSLKGEARP